MKKLPDDYNIEMRFRRSQLIGKDWQKKINMFTFKNIKQKQECCKEKNGNKN